MLNHRQHVRRGYPKPRQPVHSTGPVVKGPDEGSARAQAAAARCGENVAVRRGARRQQTMNRHEIPDRPGLAILETDREGHLVRCSNAFCALTGYSLSDLLGKPQSQFFTPPVRPEGLDLHEAALQDWQHLDAPLETALLCKDGTSRACEIVPLTKRDTQGSVLGVEVIAHDISSHRLYETRLQSISQQLEDTDRELSRILEQSSQTSLEAEIISLELNQIFNTSGDGMWVIDDKFRVQRINQTLMELLGKDAKETIGQPCYDLFSGSLCRSADCPMTRLRRGESRIECDIEKLNGNGATTPFILTATPFRGVDGEFIGLVEAFKDITDRKHAEEALQAANLELQRLATVDGLTQVGNRRYFDESLEREWARLRRAQEPLSLIMCDVDHFKLFNDTYGHLAGDDCLREVAAALSACIKRSSDLVARYGGEEFVVILPNTTAPGALHLAETMRAAIMERKIPHCRSSTSPYVTLSLGVAGAVPALDLPAETLLHAADEALYHAKQNGRNQAALGPFGG